MWQFCRSIPWFNFSAVLRPSHTTPGDIVKLNGSRFFGSDRVASSTHRVACGLCRGVPSTGICPPAAAVDFTTEGRPRPYARPPARLLARMPACMPARPPACLLAGMPAPLVCPPVRWHARPPAGMLARPHARPLACPLTWHHPQTMRGMPHRRAPAHECVCLITELQMSCGGRPLLGMDPTQPKGA